MKLICRNILHSCGMESGYKALALVEDDNEAELQLANFNKYSDFMMTTDIHYGYREGYSAEEIDDVYYKLYDPIVFNNAKSNLRVGRLYFEKDDKTKYRDQFVIFEADDESKLLEYLEEKAEFEYDELWIDSKWIYKINK